MTKEQLSKYEELSNAVDAAHEDLTDAIQKLAAMSIGANERAIDYVIRLENAMHDAIKCKKSLEQAQADKKAFVVAL